MSFIKSNDSLVYAGEDSESGFDQIQAEFIQHFKDEIRISNMGGASDKDVAVDGDKPHVIDRDKEAVDQISTDAVRKAQKLRRDSDVTSSVPQSDESKLFDAGGGGVGGNSNSGASQVSHCFASGTSSGVAGTNSFVFGCISPTSLEKPDDSAAAITLQIAGKGRTVSKHHTIGKVYRKNREPQLNASFPSKIGAYELKILKQPEEQHRARYLTEGSRGTVKDQSGQGHPTVKLCGYDQPVPLQVFVGTDVGRMKPHGFYQACKVSNKNSTACVERDIEGTTVIEIMFDPKQEMVAVVDCVGILKLRNADVEQRIGLAKSKKKSTCARLIFRVNIPKPDNTFHTLQVASSPIICTQPTGAPEISKKSINYCSVKGGEELFIIGKNFLKGTVVYFEEVRNDQPIWSKEAEIDQDFFQATHLVCTVPSYKSLDVKHPVQIQIVVHSGGRISDPVSFTYLPNVKTSLLPSAEASIPMETETAALGKNLLQEVSGLKRPYDSSPQTDTSYLRSAGDVTTDVSHILGHGGATADFRDEYADSKLLQQQKDPNTAIGGQALYDAPCGIPVMDSLTKSAVDAFILPLQSLETNSSPSVDNIPCFQDSKDAVPITGVYDNLYDSSVAPNLVGKVLSTHSQRDLEMAADQITNLMMSSLPSEGLLQSNSRGRVSLTEQIGVIQSPTDHVVPLMGPLPGETLDYGEPQSKRLASYQQTSMDILMQLIQAESSSQKVKPKEEMNWSSMTTGDAAYNLSTNSNLTSLANSESRDSCCNVSNQLESLSNFAVKNFDPVPSTTTSVQPPPVLFTFDHDIMQSSFMHPQVTEVKPDTSFSGIDEYLHDSIRYTNSSSPQSMDTSCPAGLFQDTNPVDGLNFSVSSANREDDKSSLFGTHLRPDPPKEPAVLSGFRNRSRSCLPESLSRRNKGNASVGDGNNQVHLVGIRGDSCELVGMDFRNMGQSGFGNLKSGCSEMHDIMDSHHLPNKTHSVTEINQIASQNLILHHSGMNNTEMALLGVTQQMADSGHHMSCIEQNLHTFSNQDQAQLNSQQLYTQPTCVEVASTHSFSDADKMPDCIGMELPDMDSLMHIGNPRSTAMNSMHGLNDISMPAAMHQVQIDIASGNHLQELDRKTSHATSVLTIGSMSPLGTGAVTVADGCLSTDSGSMQSNLQQSLSELHDLKQQMGFSGPQSPTRMAKMSVAQTDQDGNISPKAEFSVSNEPSKLLVAPPVLRIAQEQEALHPISNCSPGSYGSPEMTNLQRPLDCPQTTSNSQTLHGENAFAEMYYNFIQDLTSKAENLNVQMVSSSNQSLESSLESDIHLLPHSSVPGTHILTTGEESYIGTTNGVTNDSESMQQPVAQPLLTQHTPVQRHVLLQNHDGSQVIVPVSSVLLSSSSNKPIVTVAKQKSNEYMAVPTEHSLLTAVTLMDYKQIVGTVIPSGKIICLPPDVVSALTGKVESGVPVSSPRQVLVVSTGSLQQPNLSPIQMATEQHLTSDLSSTTQSSADCLYSLAMSNGGGNVKFMPNTTTVPPQTVDLSLSGDNRQDHQPMDTSLLCNHFTQDTPSEPQQRPCEQLRNNSSSCKIPTLLYQLLTTDDTRGTVRGTPTTAPMSCLPNLSVDDEIQDQNQGYSYDFMVSRQSHRSSAICPKASVIYHLGSELNASGFFGTTSPRRQ